MGSGHPVKGRGAAGSPHPRFLLNTRSAVDDGWSDDSDDAGGLKTTVQEEQSRSIISRNKSPDVPFEQSINPYRGCEHGCIYCYARPTHSFVDLSPGLDFESRLFAKINAPELLRYELGKRNYRCSPIALGANTDAYQPIERRYRITRRILEVLEECRHPVYIITKSVLAERDLDLLRSLARHRLVKVIVSVTTLDSDLMRRMEPRAAAPARRVEMLRRLSAAGIPTGVLFAPVIPFLNDNEIEQVLQAVSIAGAESAGYVMIRLPYEIRDLFEDWLHSHEPLKAERVLNRIRDIRDGRLNDPEFGTRMRGSGAYADLIEKRFRSACTKYGLNKTETELKVDQFVAPLPESGQLSLL